MIRRILGIGLLLGVASCSSPDRGAVIRLAELPEERVALDTEWRDARRIPSGGEYYLPMGLLPRDAQLRIGVLDGGPGNGVDVNVLVDGRSVQHFVTGAKGEWEDRRFSLEPEGASCGLALESASSFAMAPCEVIAANASLPNVLLFLIDTLRQDHLGCYGYYRDTSPHIDALAQDAVRFTELISQSSWTKPSVASLLTSTYPSVHGAQDRPDVLRPGLPKLGGALGNAGFETHAFMSNRNCIPVWGFGDEFFRFLDADSQHWLHADDAATVDAVIETLEFAAGRQWFFFVHTMGPHYPYEPPPPFDDSFAPDPSSGSGPPSEQELNVGLYDGEIANTDAQFGRLVNRLKELGLYENTLIIVLSDHGEEFGEHGGTQHGTTLFEEQLRVPLLIKLPGNKHAGTVCHGLVESLDVAPSILEVLGLPAVPRFQGSSFVRALSSGKLKEKPAYASLLIESRRIRAVRTKTSKYIHDIRGGTEYWYDLAVDPGEQHPATSPVPGGAHLPSYANLIATQGQHGLHLLITNDGKTDGVIHGVIECGPILAHEIRYPPERTKTAPGENRFEFDFDMRPSPETEHIPPKWETAYDVDPFLQFVASKMDFGQDSASLRLDIPLTADIELAISVNGTPLTGITTPAGTKVFGAQSGKASFSAKELVSSPDAFDPASLPRQFAVYLWYVPLVETIDDEELPLDLRQALEDLGYGH